MNEPVMILTVSSHHGGWSFWSKQRYVSKTGTRLILRKPLELVVWQ